MTIQELTAIEGEIKSIQEKVKKLLPENDNTGGDAKNELIADLNGKLDVLQKQYQAGMGSRGSDPESLQKVYEGAKLRSIKLPEIEEQISFAKSLAHDENRDINISPAAISPEGMWSAIYQSLIAAKLLSESKGLISDTESVIMEIGRPYDLIGSETRENASNAIQIAIEKEGDKFTAHLDAFGGVGDTEIEALINLLIAREKSKQRELFPEGGRNMSGLEIGTPVTFEIKGSNKSEFVESTVIGIYPDGLIDVRTFNGAKYARVHPQFVTQKGKEVEDE